MAVAVRVDGGNITTGEPQPLFRVPLNDITRDSFAPYDVAPDGERFLLNVPDALLSLLLIDGVGGLLDRAR